mmetsp:Transcript_8933/g.27653  ORF Transcript_8933/g.27653 Transcript_8933/m.27653 type:complete len:386 (-) Transcript_8933:20-1177(-)
MAQQPSKPRRSDPTLPRYDYEQDISLQAVDGGLYRVAKLRTPILSPSASRKLNSRAEKQPTSKKPPTTCGMAIARDSDIEASLPTTSWDPAVWERALIEDCERKCVLLRRRIDCAFHARMIGKGGATLRELESGGGCRIKVVQRDSDLVEIEGPSAAAVLAASHRIQRLLTELLPTMAPTHFLSIPLNTPELTESLDHFHASVAQHSGSWQNFSPRLAASASRLHLTIQMLTLPSQERLEQAQALLTRCKAHIYDLMYMRPLKLRLRGLACMNNNLSKARVIYAKIEDVGGEGRLLSICNYLREQFAELTPERERTRELTLHVTLFNTSIAGRDAKPYDATDLLRRFGTYDFGEIRAPGVQLSQRYSYDESGFYSCKGEIRFPTE